MRERCIECDRRLKPGNICCVGEIDPATDESPQCSEPGCHTSPAPGRGLCRDHAAEADAKAEAFAEWYIETPASDPEKRLLQVEVDPLTGEVF